MKAMIEVNIPAGRSIAEAHAAVKRAFDEDWVSIWWHISDVHEQANNWDSDEPNEITDDEAREVLRLADKNHDSNIGISWEVLESWIDYVVQQRRKNDTLSNAA